jgi:hypothetical protein
MRIRTRGIGPRTASELNVITELQSLVCTIHDIRFLWRGSLFHLCTSLVASIGRKTAREVGRRKDKHKVARNTRNTVSDHATRRGTYPPAAEREQEGEGQEREKRKENVKAGGLPPSSSHPPPSPAQTPGTPSCPTAPRETCSPL